VPVRAIVLLTVFLVLASSLLLYCIWAFWPTDEARSARGVVSLSEEQRVALFGAHITVNLDVVLFVIVAAAGALGGLVHGIRSLTWYVGNRNLRWSWVAFYVMLPLVGAISATVFYLVFRAGLFSPSATTTQVNPFGFAAIAGMVGLFSEQAMEKLRDVFDSLLAPARQGADVVEPHDEPSETDRTSS
jgi:archaellum biogenesis protein FlaJ (TadC family)